MSVLLHLVFGAAVPIVDCGSSGLDLVLSTFNSVVIALFSAGRVSPAA